MKRCLTPIAAILCLTGTISMPVLAATTTDASQVAQIDAKTKSLESELATLKQQLRAVKSEVRTNKQNAKKARAARMDADHMTVSDTILTSGKKLEALPIDLDVPGQAFVSTGPYVGVPIQFSGSDLVVNSPSVNTDIQLLAIRKTVTEHLRATIGSLMNPDHSHLLLSGVVEGQANYTRYGASPSTSGIDLTNVALDAFFMGPSDWTLGFIEFNYDNANPSASVYGSTVNSGYTPSNSRLYVNKAFITIGDFEKSPVYGTLGQYYVPFGTYSSVMVSDTLTKLLARTKARAIEIGFMQQCTHAFYASAYAFRGFTQVGSNTQINNGGINAGYKFKSAMFSGNVGAGILGNLADSGGMQAGTGFQSYEILAHRVPAYDLRGTFDYNGNMDFIAEYISASKRFNVNDMMYNGHGAKPWALDLEAAYSFTAFDRPTSVGIGYGEAKQALALGIPDARYSMVVNTSIWRNTLQSLEFRHDTSYSSSDTANGPVGAAAGCTAATCTQSGSSDNAVTAQFDYYF